MLFFNSYNKSKFHSVDESDQVQYEDLQTIGHYLYFLLHILLFFYILSFLLGYLTSELFTKYVQTEVMGADFLKNEEKRTVQREDSP